MARPRKPPDERRDAQLPPVRVTAAERVFIEEQAAIAGVAPSEFVRRRALGRRIAPAPSAANDRLLLEINRVGVNLNQIARSLNSDRPERADLFEALAELRRVLGLVVAHGP